ncbi:MAG: aldo/keto reductase [Psychroserpens sp.]|nr:aldo/keto reductase [Psychroserpens sp.]MBO6630448.1 aldo/keto reductase [Psychroserpens sp.]MBO6652816.1 aldo/keto reductase [Psychroserpens sp.]MBO6681412.1 aldo/keto reductase [Psychroserpens sp.]MBO6749187.1 aldo/keto reductase [Psychroserpens sp.]
MGLGTAAIGRPLYINVRQSADEKPFSLPKFKEDGLQVLEDAYSNGIRFFDTSPGYGLAEQLLIDWLKKKNDPDIVVSTKWGYTYVANFDPNAKHHEVKEHSINKLNNQWEFSKILLPHLKVYQIHSATLDTGVLENKAVLSRLHEIKKTYNITIGLTTTGDNQTEILEKGLSIEVENERLFQSFQCTFNILDQSLFRYANELQNISGPFIIKEALANGRLIPDSKYPKYFLLYDFLMELADEHNVGADAIAIRYCMDKFPNVKILSGADNCIHLRANLRANQFSLSEDEIARLDSFGVRPFEYWQERKSLQWN